MHLYSLVKFCQFVLKIFTLDLININALTKFGEILSISSQDI